MAGSRFFRAGPHPSRQMFNFLYCTDFSVISCLDSPSSVRLEYGSWEVNFEFPPPLATGPGKAGNSLPGFIKIRGGSFRWSDGVTIVPAERILTRAPNKSEGG